MLFVLCGVMLWVFYGLVVFWVGGWWWMILFMVSLLFFVVGIVEVV